MTEPTLEEAADPLFNIHTKGGVKGHINPHLGRCEHCADLRAYGLAVLDSALMAGNHEDNEGSRPCQICVDVLRDRITKL